MPDHAAAFVAPIARSAHGRLNGFVNGIVLVIRRKDFRRLHLDQSCFRIFLLRFLKYDEVAHEVQQGGRLKHALQQGIQLWFKARGFLHPIGSLPGHVTAQVGRQTAGFAFEAVRDDTNCIVGEQTRNGRLVGLQLLVRTPDVGLFAGGVFNSITTSGIPLTNKSTSGRFFWLFSTIVY